MFIKKRPLIPMNLQFFAEGSSDDSGNQNGADDNNQQTVQLQDGSQNDGTQNSGDVKTFTQEEVSKMMAKEKREGKKSVLTSLGFESEEDAKKAFNLLKALTDSQKDESQINKEDIAKANAAVTEAENKALLAEAKLSCLMAGVNKDLIDDVITIAISKITDDTNLDKVLEDMKKETKYASFFNSDNNSSGTGNNPGHNQGGNSTPIGDYGKRLAEANKASIQQKSNYFN